MAPAKLRGPYLTGGVSKNWYGACSLSEKTNLRKKVAPFRKTVASDYAATIRGDRLQMPLTEGCLSATVWGHPDPWCSSWAPVLSSGRGHLFSPIGGRLPAIRSP